MLHFVVWTGMGHEVIGNMQEQTGDLFSEAEGLPPHSQLVSVMIQLSKIKLNNSSKGRFCF